MKKMIALFFMLICLLGTVSCTGKPNETSDMGIVSNEELELRKTVELISKLFEENGYHTKCENVEHFILSGDRYALFLDDDFNKLISIYSYETVDDAQADAKGVSQDGYSTTNTVCIDWISTPHFFLYDNLILQYTGTDKSILAILTDLCGEQFAGGDITEELDSIAQSEVEAIAIAQCKVNYDYIGVDFDDAEKVWKVGFWENDAVVAAQTVTIDTAGNILNNLYAEQLFMTDVG